MDRVTQKQRTVKCDLPTDNCGLQKGAVDRVTQNQQTVICDPLTGRGKIVEDSSRHSDTEQKVVTM